VSYALPFVAGSTVFDNMSKESNQRAGIVPFALFTAVRLSGAEKTGPGAELSLFQTPVQTGRGSA